MSDTIAAISTPPGIGGIALLRISGPDALPVADRVFRGRIKPSESESFRAMHGTAVHPGTGREIDQVVLTPARGPGTYTGEDLVEIGCHGGKRVPRLLLEALIEAGARLAGPGEFTKRAVLHGKLDLVQARAVLEIIEAESEEAVRLARDRLAGRVSARYDGLKSRFLGLLERIEGSLDFPEDIPEPSRSELLDRVNAIGREIETLLREGRKGRAHLRGVDVAIAGRTNVGKSTLFNAILGWPRAIVTEEPGTTRDVVSEPLNLGGFPLTLSDTAGRREPRGTAERMGVDRARERTRSADLVLFVVDASSSITREDADLWAEAKVPAILVLNKIDLGIQANPSVLKVDSSRLLRVSALNGEGIDGLKRHLEEELVTLYGRAGEFSASIREEGLLHSVRQDLREAESALRDNAPLDIVSIPLHAGLRRLDEILGIGSIPDTVLDRVFRDFCVGK
jgi:tRNA modification GTPase